MQLLFGLSDKSILENHSIEELKQVKDIDLLAKQEELEFKSTKEVGIVLK